MPALSEDACRVIRSLRLFENGGLELNRASGLVEQQRILLRSSELCLDSKISRAQLARYKNSTSVKVGSFELLAESPSSDGKTPIHPRRGSQHSHRIQKPRGVCAGLRIAAALPDVNPPYGHSKAEPLAALGAPSALGHFASSRSTFRPQKIRGKSPKSGETANPLISGNFAEDCSGSNPDFEAEPKTVREAKAESPAQ